MRKNRTATLLACLLPCLVVAGVARAAPVEWSVASGGNGHLYDTTPTGSSWTDAEAYAVSQGGHLVTIDDAAEMAFIQSTFLNGALGGETFWIGLTSPTGDWTDPATWGWVSGSTSTYRNWRAGQPDFGTGNNDRYAVVNFIHGNDPTWDNFPDSSFGTPRGIFEVVPVPAAAWLLGPALMGLVGFTRRRRFVLD
jgi:hypothetical protein